MKLEPGQQLIVPRSKIVDYLLSVVHPVGRHKAAFFLAHGFRLEQWRELAAALERHALDNGIARIEPSSFGTRYIAEGPLVAPGGRFVAIRSVWFVEKGAQLVRLVTAYPLEDWKDD